MDLTAALQHYQKLVEAAAPQRRIVVCDREPENVYFVEHADGSLERTTADPPEPQHQAADLETLAAWVKNLESEGVSAVWYDRDGLVAGATPADEHSPRCLFGLSPSPQMLLLIAWDRAGGVVVKQAQMIMLLRTTLAACWPNHPDLLTSVRRVRTTKAAEVDAEIQAGRVSMSRKDVREMSGLAALPEEVKFWVPVFAQATVTARATVRVALEPDPTTESFQLVVLPGDVEHAWHAGEEWLRLRMFELLGPESPVLVYRGKP